MSLTAAAIRFRLSDAQLSILVPGLDLLIGLHYVRQLKDRIRYEYPFKMYPPPAGFDRGTFDLQMMDEIRALWDRLHPKLKIGGRVQMNAVELRAAVFGIRAFVGYVRRRRYDCRLKSAETKNEPLIDDRSFEQLKIRSHRMIHCLERHMKRANSALPKSVTREEYAALIGRWKSHLRWMRIHLVYFKPLRPVVGSGRLWYQKIIFELIKMAERGIRNAGYKSPEPRELRRMMRLFVRSTRRCSENGNTVQGMLGKKRDFDAKWYLAQFVLNRLTLEELTKP